jgi:hypothetical protein
MFLLLCLFPVSLPCVSLSPSSFPLCHFPSPIVCFSFPVSLPCVSLSPSLSLSTPPPSSLSAFLYDPLCLFPYVCSLCLFPSFSPPRYLPSFSSFCLFPSIIPLCS